MLELIYRNVSFEKIKWILNQPVSFNSFNFYISCKQNYSLYMTNKNIYYQKHPFTIWPNCLKFPSLGSTSAFWSTRKKNSEKKVQSNLSEGCHSGFVRRRFCYYYGPFPKLLLSSVCSNFLAISLSELIYEFTHTVASITHWPWTIHKSKIKFQRLD